MENSITQIIQFNSFRRKTNPILVSSLFILLLFSVSSALAQDAFITTWKTDNPGSSNATSITIPVFSGETYDYAVDWNNDGIFDQIGITGSVTHDFGTAGTYTIRITGTFPRIFFNGATNDKEKIISIDQWGAIAWTSMNGAFNGCSNLTSTATDAPDLSGVTDMSFMFAFASSFNSDLNNWNTSNVTNMASMFQAATAFNGNISAWNTTNVTNMSQMFRDALSFNSDLSNWNTTNVTNMIIMFSNANSFNADLSNWNTSNVTNMFSMFSNANSFTSDLSNWNTANVTNMSGMFSSAFNFTSDLSNWNTANVTNMSTMFNSAVFFTSDLSNWNTANVTDMSNMFTNAGAFNSDLSNWNTANVTNMIRMFRGAISFNSDLSNWNTANVTNMSFMFRSANSFNSDLSNWNTANVTDMSEMFRSASSFNSNLGNWELNANVNMTSMLTFSGLSTTNYDNTLIGWNNNPNTPSGRSVGVNNLKYCTGEAARNNLISNGWTFTGDSKLCPAPEIAVTDADGDLLPDGSTIPFISNNTDFGTVLVSGGTQSFTYTIDNTGTGDLILSSTPKVAISGTHASDFTVTLDPNSPISPNGNTTFSIEFDPSDSGTRTAMVTIENNDANEGTYTFAIGGVGDCPQVSFTATDVCTSFSATVAGNNTWTPIFDGSGNIVAAINAPSGVALGTVTVELKRTNSIQTHPSSDGMDYKLLPRYFHLSASGYGAGVNFPANVGVRLHFTNNDLNILNNTNSGTNGTTNHAPADLKITHYDGPNQDCEIDNNEMISANVALLSPTAMDYGCGDHYLEISVPHFSEFIPHEPTPQALLPVEYTYFTAKATAENTTQLNWQTASEFNNEGFEIQWKGKEEELAISNWEIIGFVEGNGTTNDIQNYQFLHDRPVISANYYRLKQLDFDGKFEYSDIQTVNFKNGQTTPLHLFPNPVTEGTLTVESEVDDHQPILINIYDLTGKTWLQQTSFDANTRVNVSDLAAGVYIVEIAGNGQTSRQKIVIE